MSDERRQVKFPGESIQRRKFLKGAAATAGLVIAPAFLRGARGDAWAQATSLFPLGVASGDPDEHSVVLWTRLAADPLAGGGLPNEQIGVTWQVALDQGMRRVVRHGVAVARPETGHTVRLAVGGLPADQWLYYRFATQGKYRGHSSRIGRTRTFPHADSSRRFRQAGGERCRTEDMRFAVASCQHFIAGYYAAWADIASQDLDFVVHVGDYIYEDRSASPLPGRSHQPVEIFSVDDYRNRYALYRLDAHLQDAHARFPFIVTPDDHEVDNNYAGLVAEEGAPYEGDVFAERRRNAYQVYAESMPVRTLLAPDSADRFQVFRRLQFGDLADIHVLDTRQFRTDQPAEDGFGTTDVDTDPVTAGILEQQVFRERLFDAAGILDGRATLLGARQEVWLALNLLRSRAEWNVLAQQVMLMPWNLRETGKLVAQAGGAPPPVLAAIGTLDNILNVDAWDGYRRARERLMTILGRVRPPSPVILTGDIHSAWAANLFADFGDTATDVLAVELVCSSITSTFLGVDPRPTHAIVRAGLPDNPHIRYFNGMFRGYCLCEVDRHEWRTQFRAVGAPADLQDPSEFALVPMEGDPLFTDAVAVIPRGFNRREEPETLAVQGVVTGAS